MTFEQFRQYLVENKNSIYYHLINYTFNKKGCNVYVLNRNNPYNPKNTRSAGNGAHFRVTCWRDNDEKGIPYEYYIYWTKAHLLINDIWYSDIRGDVVEQLDSTCKIVFAKPGFYSIPVDKKFIKKYGIMDNGKYRIPQSRLHWVEINESVPAPDTFKPEYIPFYTWNHANHCNEVSVNVYKNEELVSSTTFKSIKDLYTYYKFETKGMGLQTLRVFIKNHQNFILDGVVFIFDETWETVSYKIRKRKVETVEEVITKDDVEEIVSSIEKTWEESEGKVTESIVTNYMKEPEYYGDILE